MKNPILFIKNTMTKKRRAKLKADLIALNLYDETAYDHFKLKLPLVDTDLYGLGLLERYCWSKANGYYLLSFYHANGTQRERSFFWRKVPSTYRQVHSGIPRLISDTMTRVLFSSGINYQVQYYQDAESMTPDEKESDRITDILRVILEDNRIMEQLAKGAFIESWAGGVVYKISNDPLASPFPLVEAVDPRNVTLLSYRGKVKAIIFKRFYEKNNQQRYVHEEVYTTDDEDSALIENHLYLVDPSDSKKKEVPLNTIPETSHLEPVIKFDKIKGMLAFYKKNKVSDEDVHGVSDYEGSIDLYDVMDEICSEIAEEVRQNKTRLFIPANLVPRDDQGNPIPNNPFKVSYISLGQESQDQIHKETITAPRIEGRHQELIEKYKDTLMKVLNNAGLSPITIGVTGLESLQSSDSTLQERQRTTSKTREIKIDLWQQLLKELFLKILEVYSLSESSGDSKINFENTDISVAFPAYISETIESKITTWGGALQMKVVSLEEAVRKIHGDDKTEDEIKQEIEKNRKDSEIERGQAVDSNVPENEKLF
jgi:A118 family predicted phage portal protein